MRKKYQCSIRYTWNIEVFIEVRQLVSRLSYKAVYLEWISVFDVNDCANITVDAAAKYSVFTMFCELGLPVFITVLCNAKGNFVAII